VFDLLEEISVPMHVQDYTVEFYTKTIENALAEYIQHIAGNKGYFGCAMGRYLMRTAQVDDEFDFIIAAESKSFDVEEVLFSELRLFSDVWIQHDPKEDGYRFRLVTPVYSGTTAITSQIHIRILLLPKFIFSRFAYDGWGLIPRYKDVISGRWVPDEQLLTPLQSALITRHQLFFYLNSNISWNRDESFRRSAILLRQMAMNRGIEGRDLGYLSPTVLELLTFKYCVEIEASPDQVAGEYIQDIATRISKFPYQKYEWHVSDQIAKVNTSDILEVYHPINQKRLLNPYTTPSTTKTILNSFAAVSEAHSLDQFTQSIEDALFFNTAILCVSLLVRFNQKALRMSVTLNSIAKATKR